MDRLLVLPFVLVWFWPRIVLWNERSLSETELIAISAGFQGINSKHIRHIGVCAVAVVLILMPMFLFPTVYFEHAYQSRLAHFVIALAAVAFLDARFARANGVYFDSKFYGSRTTYAFVEPKKLERIALTSQVISLVVSIAAMVYVGFGFVRGWDS